jgi:hypothetical protein
VATLGVCEASASVLAIVDSVLWSLASDVVVVAIAGSGSAERRLSAILQRFSSVLS